MKTHPSVVTELKTKHAVKALPELTVDWNMNRYVGGVASNNPSDDIVGYDIEIFPVESLIEPNRPTKGINKARIASATIGEDYRIDAGGVANGRFYVADVDDTYKYWTSPLPTDTSGNVPVFNSTNFPSPSGETYPYDSLTSVRPQVIYAASTEVNKIVITTENTWATAKTFSIQTTTSATPTEASWTTIATQTIGNTWKASGQIVLWYNGSTWVTTGRVDNTDKTPRTTTIRGVRMVVTALEGGYKKADTLIPTTYKVSTLTGGFTDATTDGKESFFDLIEISARLEVDLTPFVLNIDDNFEFSDASKLYPIGTVTSNQATVVLSNLYRVGNNWEVGLFSADNASSPYRNYIEANAEMTLKYVYYNEAGAVLDKVQQFKMYADQWSEQTEDAVNVDLSDFSKFFDTSDLKLRASLWEELKVSEIVWRLLDSVGFVNYQIDTDADRVTDHTIPIFYTDGEKTLWEVLDDLAQQTQTAIYFDAYGVLQVKTRDFAFSADDAPVWDLTAVSVPTKLADIEALSGETEFQPNHYKVIYQTTNWSPDNNGQPTMQRVWEPESETVVLRATPLLFTIENNATVFNISPDDVRFWPYKSLVNVEGELIRYDAKYFVYYTGATGLVRNEAWIESDDDLNAKTAQTLPAYRHKNHLTGALRITERGVWNSEPVRHTVEAEGYSVRNWRNGTRDLTATGFVHDKAHSRVQLMSGARFSNRHDIKLATRGSTADQPFFNYGTRFRFLAQSGRTDQCGGLVIHNNGTGEDGYYFELRPSRFLDAKARATRQEFLAYTRLNGKDKLIGTTAVAVGENIDYEMDVSFKAVGGNHQLLVWINGKQVLSGTITSGDQNTANGKFGMFIRGRSRAEYEYLYAIRREEESPLLEDFSFLDKVERGYMGGQWDREWVYRWKDYRRRVKKKWKKGQRRINRQFFDEFGPILHEIREFDAKFDPSPVLHSRLYMSNDWAGCAIEYHASPFGAKFVIANTSRRNAVIHGEDSMSFSGTGDVINQILTVLGRALEVAEGEEVIAKNEEQIRRRGKFESEVTGEWIQSEGMAKDLANWLNANFSYGNDQYSVETFANPLLELGDVVTVNYPDKHISGSFFVTGISTSFDSGLHQTLTLRRRAV